MCTEDVDGSDVQRMLRYDGTVGVTVFDLEKYVAAERECIRVTC